VTAHCGRQRNGWAGLDRREQPRAAGDRGRAGDRRRTILRPRVRAV